MKRMVLLITSAFTVLLMLTVACGGDDDNTTTTETPTETESAMPSETHMAGSPGSDEEVAAAFTTARDSLAELIDKANEGDLDASKEAYEPADDALHMIEDALFGIDESSLADSIENKQHGEIEDPLNSGDPDLTAIATATQEILDLLDQAADKLNITAQAGETPSAAELTDYLATLKSVMEETKAKADAGDVPGTQEAEGKGDDAIEALIKAVRDVDPTLADNLENLELDYEEQADSADPDLTVISQDAQAVLDLLPDVAAALNISQ